MFRNRYRAQGGDPRRPPHTPLAVTDAPASGRMAIAEAVTNIAAAAIDDIGDVRMSANWMAAAGEPDQDAVLFDTVRAVAMELCPALGIAIPLARVAGISIAGKKGILVRNFTAFEMARRLAREEGIFVGMSAGAAMQVAVEQAVELGQGDDHRDGERQQRGQGQGEVVFPESVEDHGSDHRDEKPSQRSTGRDDHVEQRQASGLGLQQGQLAVADHATHIVGIVAQHHAAQPPVLFRNRIVAMLPAVFIYTPDCPRVAFLRRSPYDHP